jgi:hypothetical protein
MFHHPMFVTLLARHAPRLTVAAVLITVAIFGSSLFLSGCGGGSLQLTRVNSEQKKPNNVWVFFTVKKGDDPVGGLQAEDFKIYEDDGLVSKFESKQTIQNPEVAAVMYTLLLLDVSGSITESGQADNVVEAGKLFTDKVGKTQKVAVYSFDGDEKIHPVVPFTETEGALEGGLDGLKSYKPKDPSTNLHGAVVEALATLKTALDREQKPLKFGTLVVFSDGADRAGRVKPDEMKKELDKKDYEHYEIYAIGIGDKTELESANLDDIGRDGTEEGQDRAKVKESFEKIANKIDAHAKRFYLLSYCTPSRKGEHVVRIEVDSKKVEGSGRLEYSFSADGFGPPPACDPERKPTFKLDDVEEKPGDDDDSGKSKASAKMKAD